MSIDMNKLIYNYILLNAGDTRSMRLHQKASVAVVHFLEKRLGLACMGLIDLSYPDWFPVIAVFLTHCLSGCLTEFIRSVCERG